jgi:hypothetical protein
MADYFHGFSLVPCVRYLDLGHDRFLPYHIQLINPLMPSGKSMYKLL